ncbi:MAG: hypothetical protein U0235_25550 [Polyangiaceae bacterium]
MTTPKNDRPRARRLLLGVTAIGASTALTACGATDGSSNGPVGDFAQDGGPDARPGIDAGLSVVGTQVGDAGPAVGKVAQDAGPIGDFVQDAGPDVVTVDAGTSIGDAGDGG